MVFYQGDVLTIFYLPFHNSLDSCGRGEAGHIVHCFVKVCLDDLHSSGDGFLRNVWELVPITG